MRQLRLRQRATGTQRSQPIPAQQEQGDDIVNLTTVEEEEAVATSLSMGIRKSPELDVPNDPLDGPLLQDADEVDEHNSLILALEFLPSALVTARGVERA